MRSLVVRFRHVLLTIAAAVGVDVVSQLIAMGLFG